jgi:hypothetical protein
MDKSRIFMGIWQGEGVPRGSGEWPERLYTDGDGGIHSSAARRKESVL